MAQSSLKRSPIIDSPNSIFPGKALKLRDGVLKRLSDRDWLFNKFEKDLVFLIHSSRAYGIIVKKEDIDWKV